MSECACLYGGFDDYDEGGFQVRTQPRARKEYVCIECRQPIRKGEHYSRFASKYDGAISTSRTCLVCEEIREALYCDGYYFGCMWDDIKHQIFMHRGLTVECVDKLKTPEAKRVLQQRWMEFVERRAS